MSTPAYAALQKAADSHPPIAAIVLGSGLNEITDRWPMLASASFQDLPGMPKATVAGHHGRLLLQTHEDRPVLVFQGRIHFYEGHGWEMVSRPVQIAAELGARIFLLTNASGGIGAEQIPGSLMLVRNHIAAMVPNWWKSCAPVDPYSGELKKLVCNAAASIGQPITAGTYACVTGPNYETPAEIRALKSIGANAVGMSTVYEATIAAGMGLRVAAVSCVANWAAGISPTPLSHREVLESVRSVAAKLGRILSQVIARLAS